MTALAGSGHSIYWYRLSGGDRIQEERELPQGIHIVRQPFRKNSVRWLDYPQLGREFKQRILEIKPDIIHAGPIQRVALLPVLAAFHPLISMSWGFDMLEDANRNFFWKKATQYVLKNSDWMIADCQTVKRTAMDYGIPGERITVFPWGVDLKLFSPKNRNKARKEFGYEDELLIVHTRSWEPRYGVDIALKGFKNAMEQIPNLHMIMLSGGSQSTDVRDFVKSNGLTGRIHFHGYLKNEELVRYYRAADVYLTASHIDGSSVALMESMACGCPAIVSDISSNLEWISEGVEGLAFHDGDAGHLGEKIVQAAVMKKELRKMGRSARLKTEKYADWENGVEKLLATYKYVAEMQKSEDNGMNG